MCVPGAGAAMAMRTAVSTVLTITRPGRASLGGHTSLDQRVYPPKILTYRLPYTGNGGMLLDDTALIINMVTLCEIQLPKGRLADRHAMSV